MPTIKIERYKFRFYSSDASEPPHVHVIDGDKVAKIWLRQFQRNTIVVTIGRT